MAAVCFIGMIASAVGMALPPYNLLNVICAFCFVANAVGYAEYR